RHCLQHSGGWDRAKSYDPIGRPMEIARALQVPQPPTPEQIVHYMMGEPLDFNPGERYSYSNLGYLVLGRVIEAASRMRYEAHVKARVLAPLGLKTPQLGHALLAHKIPGEVHYYDGQKRVGAAIFPPVQGQQVPLPYGAENLDGFEAH